MRRWMIVLMVASLFVAFAATPGSAAKKDVPDPVQFDGGFIYYEGVEAWTGDYAGDIPIPWNHGWGEPWEHLMDPAFNRCELVSAELVWREGEQNTADLYTEEDCTRRWHHLMTPHGMKLMPTLPPFPPGWVKGVDPPFSPNDPNAYVKHHKVVHITKGGAVKMSPGDLYPTFWQKISTMTGCGVNGTFPIYHGHFDGERLFATAHYHGPCDGGTGWTNFGIGLEDGPIHVTYTFDLLVAG